MALSRKRKREMKRIQRSAEKVWSEQLETLEHANAVLRQAGHAVSSYASDDVAPAVRKTYQTKVRPAMASGLASGRAAADTARSRVAGDVIPAVSGAIGSVLATLEASKDPRVRDAIKSASKANKSYSKQAAKWVAPPKRKSGPGAGTFVLIALGVVAAAGIGYAAWQTFRADDDLWIEDLPEDGSGESA